MFVLCGSTSHLGPLRYTRHCRLPKPARGHACCLTGELHVHHFETFPRFSLQITQLKIASNPFAKGFRDCDPEDW